MNFKDTRPEQYRYWLQLMKHLKNDKEIFFKKDFIWPRQLEIHLPGNHIIPCNNHCSHCAGKYFQKDLGHWELDFIEVLDKLKGAIPFIIMGGSYAEPLLNPYYLTFLAMAKKYNNHFGIHTNGTLLSWLEDNMGWLTELNRISTDRVDYLSISLDAGFPWSWSKVKGNKKSYLYNDILKGLKNAVSIRNKKGGKGHAIRLCYLISPHSNSQYEFDTIVATAKDIGVDSLRFSIPFDNYYKDFNDVKKYKELTESKSDIYESMLEKHLSDSEDERPYIFYTNPWFTDINRFKFEKCVYNFFQMTAAADGYYYKCSTVSTPTAKHLRLGKITNKLEDLKKAIVANYNLDFNCQQQCFDKNLRCNRMGMEINTAFEEIVGKN